MDLKDKRVHARFYKAIEKFRERKELFRFHITWDTREKGQCGSKPELVRFTWEKDVPDRC